MIVGMMMMVVGVIHGLVWKQPRNSSFESANCLSGLLTTQAFSYDSFSRGVKLSNFLDIVEERCFLERRRKERIKLTSLPELKENFTVTFQSLTTNTD